MTGDVDEPPMALDVAEHLEPGRLIYDVMDDLASFRSAPQGLVLRRRRARTHRTPFPAKKLIDRHLVQPPPDLVNIVSRAEVTGTGRVARRSA